MNIWPLRATQRSLLLFIQFCLLGAVEEEQCQLLVDDSCIVNLNGKAGDGYYTDIVVGTPPQRLSALIDTGSSNVAVAAAAHPNIQHFFNYSRSVTLRELHVPVEVPYSQGRWHGRLVSDVVRLPRTDAPAVRCDVALIERSHHFYVRRAGWQAIVGLAFKRIALPNSSVTTWPEAAQHVLLGRLAAVAVVLCGPSATGRHQGFIGFGDGAGAELAEGPLFSAPLFRSWFYEVLLTNISVGGRRLRLPCVQLNTDKTIVDTGTTNLRLPTKVLAAVVAELRRRAPSLAPAQHAFWTGRGRLCPHTVNASHPWTLLPDMTLSLRVNDSAQFQLTLTARSYLREIFSASEPYADADGDADAGDLWSGASADDGSPAADVDVDDGTDGAGGRRRCFKLGLDASTTGTVLGAVVLEGLYVRFNLHDRAVEFAQTSCGPNVTLRGPLPARAADCGYRPRSAYSRTLHIAMYIVAAMLALICIPLLGMTVSCLKWSRRRRRPHHEASALALLVDADADADAQSEATSMEAAQTELAD